MSSESYEEPSAPFYIERTVYVISIVEPISCEENNVSKLLNVLSKVEERLSGLSVPESNLEQSEFIELLMRSRIIYTNSTKVLNIIAGNHSGTMSELESIRYFTVLNLMQVKGYEILLSTNAFISRLARIISKDPRLDISERDVLDVAQVFMKGSPEGLDNHLRKLSKFIGQTPPPRELH